MKTLLFTLASLAMASALAACSRSDPENKAPAPENGGGFVAAAAEPGENSVYSGPHVTDVAFLPDGKTLLAVYAGFGIVHWDLGNRKVIQLMENSSLTKHLALTPNGKWVIGDYLGLWEVGTGKKITSLRRDQNWIHALALSSDKKFALVGGNGSEFIRIRGNPLDNLHLYDTVSGKIIFRFPGHQGTVHSVAISSDGKLGLSLSIWTAEDPPTGPRKEWCVTTIKLWDLQNNKLIRDHEYKDGGGTVSFSADNKWMYCLGDNVRIWDVETGVLIQSSKKLGKNSGPMAFSPDKRHYITREERTDESLTLWDVLTHKVVKEVGRKEDKRFTYKVKFAPDGKKIALCGNHQLLQLFDLETGKIAEDLILPEEFFDPKLRKKFEQELHKHQGKK